MIYDKEETMLKNRMYELSKTAWYRGICTYTDFLNLNEQNLLRQCMNKLEPVKIIPFGGYHEADRKMFCFKPQAYNGKEDFPVVILKIKVAYLKYSEKLTHRDFLGAILNLGISRNKIGDIIMEGDAAYLFCHEKVADLIETNLTRVKHTVVYIQRAELECLDIKPKFEEMKGFVSSLRIDALLSVVWKGSRSALSGLISGEKVYVNSKMITSNSFVIKENDIVSVRGFGKFILKEVISKTKKGRLYILIYKYV